VTFPLARGRRPGQPNTRAQIVEAARECFADLGYTAASIRAIAARAGVDPALVHHYFTGGKAALFTEALRLRRDPRLVVEELTASGGGGAAVVRGFLGLWEEDAGGAFISVVQAMVTSPAIADAVREYLADRIWSQKAPPDDVRRALVSSQLMGLAWTRYVLRLEPLASADIDTVAALVGPTIDRYANDPLPPLPPPPPPPATAPA
jgi:AcrR family transcriptional regulator